MTDECFNLGGWYRREAGATFELRLGLGLQEVKQAQGLTLHNLECDGPSRRFSKRAEQAIRAKFTTTSVEKLQLGLQHSKVISIARTWETHTLASVATFD